MGYVRPWWGLGCAEWFGAHGSAYGGTCVSLTCGMSPCPAFAGAQLGSGTAGMALGGGGEH